MEEQDNHLTVEDIANMSTEEVLDNLLFKSKFTTRKGPMCSCNCTRMTHFLGMIPDKICDQNIDDVELANVPEFETKVSSLCGCQESHFFKVTLKEGEINFEPTEGKLNDERKLRLPNFQ
jgi:hypothetical protein